MAKKIFIGEHKGREVYLDLSKNSNGHMLVTGSTGTGKTNFLKYYLKQLEMQTIILDYSNSYEHFKEATVQNIVETPELLCFFERCTDVTMGILADAIQGAFRFGAVQRATIIKALTIMEQGMNKEKIESDEQNENNFFSKYIEFEGEKVKKTWAFFAFILSTKCGNKGEAMAARMVELVVHLSGKKVAKDTVENGVKIIKFSVKHSGLNAEMVELFLWKLWLKQIDSTKKVCLVLDECQDLNWKKGSISERLMSEGRKFGMNIILSTQFLTANFPKRVIASFEQSGTRVIFKPTEMEVVDFAKSLDVSNWKVYARKLRNLRVGSCIVSGQVYINERCSRQKIEVAVPEYKEVGN